MLPPDSLPGDEIEIMDVTGSFSTNNCTVPLRAEPIAGLAEDLVASTDHAAFLLHRDLDSALGWQVIRYQ